MFVNVAAPETLEEVPVKVVDTKSLFQPSYSYQSHCVAHLAYLQRVHSDKEFEHTLLN